MFSKKTALILVGILFVTGNVILLAITTRRPPASGVGSALIAFAAPFQMVVTRAAAAVESLWRDYLFLVSVARENARLKVELDRAVQAGVQQQELLLENQRLRELLAFQQSRAEPAVAAQIIGKDPSAWFKTVIVDKGRAHGVERGLAAVAPAGVVGQVVDAASRQSRLLLIIDRNSAVDALVQRTRTRGIVKGTSEAECYLDYVLHEEDIQVGDVVVSSGFDGIYPKGLLIGTVAGVNFQGADIFKEVRIRPAVDFDKLEEVLILLRAAPPELRRERR